MMFKRKVMVDVPGGEPEVIALWPWQTIDDEGDITIRPIVIVAPIVVILLFAVLPLALMFVRLIAAVGLPLMVIATVVVLARERSWLPQLTYGWMLVIACLLVGLLTAGIG